jgi:hypothetical protein
MFRWHITTFQKRELPHRQSVLGHARALEDLVLIIELADKQKKTFLLLVDTSVRLIHPQAESFNDRTVP